ncbi:hypothetical protein GW17_00049359 [Ensete ventricosum]|nr:hypothetical protein GW17_00049359 [Ensete ventricosum]
MVSEPRFSCERLYHVESFYAFLLHFRSEGNEEEGQPATASPHAGSATHGQAATKAPCKGVTDCGQGQPEREASDALKGWQPVGEAPVSRSVAHGCSSSRPRARPVAASPQGRQPFAALRSQRGLIAWRPQGAGAQAAGVAAP